jgi:hypothetical protein
MQTKKILGLALVPLAAIALFGAIAHAQPNTGGTGKMAARLAQLEQKLQMTPQQDAQAQTLIAQALVQARQIRSNTALTPAARHAQMARLMRTARRQFVALLTPGQRKEGKTLIGQALVRVADNLGLSAKQRTEIKTIVAAGRAQVKTTRANVTLTPTEKIAQIKTIRHSILRQALAVLTPTQRQQIKAMAAQKRQELASVLG